MAASALTPGAVASAQEIEEEEDDGAWIDPPAEPKAPDASEEDAAPEEDAVVAEEPEAAPVSPTPPTFEAVEPSPCVSCGLPPNYYTTSRKYLRPIDGFEPPPGYELAKRNRQGLWATGIGVAGAMYGFTLLTSALLAESEHDDDILRFGSFPLIGPFIVAGHDIDGLSRGFMIGLMGLGQIAGFAMIVGGVSVRVPTWRRERGTATVSLKGNGASLEMSF